MKTGTASRITRSTTESGTYDDQDRMPTYAGAAYTYAKEPVMSILTNIVRKLGETFDVFRAFGRGCEELNGIDVCGREEFRRAVLAALALLRGNRLPWWDTLVQHVDSILEGRSTAPVVTGHSAFMIVDGPHSTQEPEFLAADLAAMACSFHLYRSYEANSPGTKVPRDIYYGTEALALREKAYRECLRALGKQVQGEG